MKKLILIALACSVLSIQGLANKDDVETRTATVKYDIDPTDHVKIKAKYTDLVVEAWDKNEVEIVAEIRFDGKMTNKMTTFLDEFQKIVEENISYSEGELYIDTNVDEPNKFQIGTKHVGLLSIGFSEDELKLEYRVKAPADISYEINNSYRDLKLIGDFNEVAITQYSGGLKAGSIKKAKLNLKYGRATIESIGSSDMEIYEQKLEVNSMATLDLKAKYSDLEFERVEKIEAVSYESDYEIGNIGELEGNFKYGKINISGKIESARLEFYEMSMEASEIGTLRSTLSKYSKFEFGTANSILFDQSYEDETTIGKLGGFISKNSKYGKHTIEQLLGSFELKAYEDDVEIEDLGNQVSGISVDGKYINTSIGISNSSFILNTNVKYGKAVYDESDVDVRRYIKENDQLEVEVHSKTQSENPIRISVKGYEVDVTLK